jgi:hypothetical protein
MNYKIFLCLLLAAFFYECNDNDSYYNRPDWLEKPIYEVLQQEGNFSKYLQCLDSTKYASVMKGAGLYTVFAPNDSAFTNFLSQNGYTSVNDLPDSIIDKIVSYSICYSAFSADSLGTGGAFKFKTQNYALPYKDPEYNNEWVVDQTKTSSDYISSYNNYKYVPALTSAFFNSYTPALTAADYNIFYPGVTWTGKNIQGGEILRADMRAENGIVHEVSTVNLPLENIADILNRPESSLFKSLVDSKDVYGDYLFRTYLEVTSPSLLKTLQKIKPTEDINRIFIKYYNGLSYSLNLENIYDYGSTTYQPEKTGYTLILPSNEALQTYLTNRVLKNYGPGQAVPKEIIQTIIDSHMAPSLVWPANYSQAQNGNGDYVNGKGSGGNSFALSGITGGIMASNGLVYRTNQAIKSRIFESVYSEIFLNPVHKWSNIGFVNNFNTSLREDLQKCELNGFISERYTLLVFDDQLLVNDGFSYSTGDNTFSHAGSGVTANTRLTRLLREHLFEGINNSEVNSEITSFSTTGLSNYDSWNFTVTSFGDPVRYKNGQMQAAGNIEDNTFVNLVKLNETYLNGTVWKADKLLQYSPRVTGASDDNKYKDLTLWQYIDRARTQNPNVKQFVDYFQKCIKTMPDDNTSTALDGFNSEQFYTILMPNNTAMSAALAAKVIPPLDSVNAAYPDAFARAAFFINSHVLSGRVLMDDNIKTYLYPANTSSLNRALVPVMAKVNSERLGLTNQSLLIEVSKNTTSGVLKFVPQSVLQGSSTLVTGGTSGTVTVQRGKPSGTTIANNYRSNRIACKAVLHEVNNYFTFKLAK